MLNMAMHRKNKQRMCVLTGEATAFYAGNHNVKLNAESKNTLQRNA